MNHTTQNLSRTGPVTPEPPGTPGPPPRDRHTIVVADRCAKVRRLARLWVGAAVIVAGSSLVMAVPASATGTGVVKASPCLNLRTDASVFAPLIGCIPYNTTIAIDCTKPGTSVTGPWGATTLWDHTAYAGKAGFVSDAFVYTGTFNPVASTCGTTTSTREDRAMSWARSQLGATGWNGWCDRFVAVAYGKAHSGYPTAYAHFKDLRARGLIHTTGTPPVGALTFYGPAAVNGYAGHVMLSEGNGTYITTASTVRRVSITWPGAPYIGWSYANPEWPGRPA